MTDADVEERNRRLAMMLDVSRDFAFRQMSQGLAVLPFAARAAQDGEIDFKRYVDENTDLELTEIYDLTRAALAEEARKDNLLAATIVAAVSGADFDMGEGFDTAIQVQVEAPGYARIVLAPYRVEARAGGQDELVTGDLIAIEAEPEIFDRLQ